MLTCLFLMWNVGACASELVLPSSLTVIEEEAFSEDDSIFSVLLPEGIQEIESRAFADSALYYINIPQSISCIAPDAFEGISSPLLIQTTADSYGMNFALENNLDFRADTILRALLIGQSDYPSPHILTAPVKDIAVMKRILGSDYIIKTKENLSADQILSAIQETFGKATDADISLFYYSGHGLSSEETAKNGALVGIDYSSYVTASQLRNALDSIKGRKIIVVDACYSGGLIGKGLGDNSVNYSVTDINDEAICQNTDEMQNNGEKPAISFLRSFIEDSRRFRSAFTGQCYVLVSSAGNEESWETKAGGVFTSAFADSYYNGDANGDGVITFLECYKYTKNKVEAIMDTNDLIQSVQVYPENCYWFGVFR